MKWTEQRGPDSRAVDAVLSAATSSLVAAAVGNEARASVTDGVLIVNNATGIMGDLVIALGGQGNTVTFGSNLIVSSTDIGTDPTTSPVLRHEFGHVQQARALGPLYLPTYAALSVPAALDWAAFSYVGGLNIDLHDWHPMEIMANDYAHLPLFPSYNPARTRW